MEQNIVIKGTPQKNKPALITIIVGVVLLLASFLVASYVFENCEGYEYFGFGYGGWYYWCAIYDFEFGEFFISEFFNFSCYYGYMIMLGVIFGETGNVAEQPERSFGSGKKVWKL